jgi:hypothetical protein
MYIYLHRGSLIWIMVVRYHLKSHYKYIYIYMYTYMHICIYIYIRICTYICIFIAHTSVSQREFYLDNGSQVPSEESLYTPEDPMNMSKFNRYISIFIYIYLYTYLYVNIYIHIYINIHIYIRIFITMSLRNESGSQVPSEEPLYTPGTIFTYALLPVVYVSYVEDRFYNTRRL